MSCGLEQEIQEFTCSGFFLLWFKILSAMSGKFLYSSQEEHQLSSRLAFHQSWLIGGGHLPSEGGCLWSCIRSLCFYWGHDSPPWAAIHQAGRLAWKPSSWRTSVPLLFGSLWNTHGFAVDFTPPPSKMMPSSLHHRKRSMNTGQHMVLRYSVSQMAVLWTCLLYSRCCVRQGLLPCFLTWLLNVSPS